MSEKSAIQLRHSLNSKLNLKFILVGDPMTGKSTLLLTLKTNSFLSSNNEKPTVLDVQTKEIVIDEVRVMLQLVEAPCVDGYDNMRANLYEHANCVFICYATNNPSSFENVKNKWIPEVKQLCPNATIYLIGTKLDLKSHSNTPVPEDLPMKLLKTKEVDGFRECSAKSFESIELIFTDATKTYFRKSDPKRGSCKQT